MRLLERSRPLLRRIRSASRGAAPPEPTHAVPAEPPEWEYVPEGWARQAADPRIKGWNVEAIADAHLATWPAYVEALEPPGPLGIYHEVPTGEPVQRDVPVQQNVLISYAYVLALAARRKERISVLDWGGGIGHYYPLSKSVLPGVEIEYHVKDVPVLCRHGRSLLPEVSFHEDESCLRSRYDLVLASNSLEYSPDWKGTFAGLATATLGYFFVTRLPVTLRAPSFVVLQRAYAYGYDTEFLGWVLGREELLEAAVRADLDFRREFVFHSWSVPGAPDDPLELRGYLFEAQDGAPR